MPVSCFSSEWRKITWGEGVPQGLILGSSYLNMLMLTQIKASNQVSYHNFADDAQLYITMFN